MSVRERNVVGEPIPRFNSAFCHWCGEVLVDSQERCNCHGAEAFYECVARNKAAHPQTRRPVAYYS